MSQCAHVNAELKSYLLTYLLFITFVIFAVFDVCNYVGSPLTVC